MACLNVQCRQHAAPAGGFALGGCRPATAGCHRRRRRWRQRHSGAIIPSASHACACEGPPEEALPRRAFCACQWRTALLAPHLLLHEALLCNVCTYAPSSLGVGVKTVAQVPEGKSSRPFATPVCHVLNRSGEGGQRAAAHDPAAGGDGQAVPAPAGGARLDGALADMSQLDHQLLRW